MHPTATLKSLTDNGFKEQMRNMLEVLEVYIKLAVDVDLGILARGGELHVDCEQTLLSAGSEHANVWGADWYPFQQQVGYESSINIRPIANNRSMEIQSAVLRDRIDQIVKSLLGDVQWQ